jgi:hypothetical protein
MTDHEKNIRILDAVFHEAALVEAEDGTVTPELRADVDAIMAHVQDRLAALNRAAKRRHLALVPAAPVAREVRPSILAMTRDAILARLADLCASQPRALLAHRDFAGMDDDDLRSALEDAEQTIERGR